MEDFLFAPGHSSVGGYISTPARPGHRDQAILYAAFADYCILTSQLDDFLLSPTRATRRLVRAAVDVREKKRRANNSPTWRQK